jgi:microcystin-dependent protein
MKIMTTSASGWMVATFSLLALFFMGVTNSSTPERGVAVDNEANYSSAVSAEPFIGEIIMFAGNFAPRGWALCNGQILPINSNQALFSLLGTTYGGDGRTTFMLPDLRGRVAVHSDTGSGLSEYKLGQKGGSESVAIPQGPKVNPTKNGKVNVAGTGTRVSNLQPYVTVNYIIATQGTYPSRN